VAIVYFDSSAFVKLVVEEDGSDIAAALWDGADAAISSYLAYPEVRAALAAAGRDQRLEIEARRQAEAAWEEYWAAARPVELSPKVTARAGELAGQYALRGADSVHLASALVVGAEDLLFAAWDERLRAGVQAAGVELVPAPEHGATRLPPAAR
jgi:predicted nucleic acid-binding protein